jgi:hypothetical protein
MSQRTLAGAVKNRWVNTECFGIDANNKKE